MQNRLAQMTRPLILDGGLATQIESQGISIDTDLWSAELLVSNARAIVAAHRAYLDAGAECIITASYQASREGLAAIGLSNAEADALILSSVALARTAVDEFMQDNSDSARPFVAASIGPYAAAVLHDGSEYTGEYSATTEELESSHADRLAVLDASGADVLACETIPNIREAEVLAELLRDVKTPAWVSFCCRDANHMSDGTPLREAAQVFADHPTVFAVGINCTAPEFVPSLIAELRAGAPDKKLVVYPNSGESYRSSDNSWHGDTSEVLTAEASLQWRDAGAAIIGGCCRMGPSHISAIAMELLTEQSLD